jgi:hypothetical protein
MAEKSQPSFSPGRRFAIGLNMLVRTALVLAVLVMVVALSNRYFHRVYLSSHTRVELSPRTVNFVKTITNRVKVTLYFNRDEEMYSTITALLAEYRALNPRLSVTTVDYQHDPAEAGRLKALYQLANAQGKDDKDLVIFDCDGRIRVLNARALVERTVEFTGETTPEGQKKFREKLVSFRGEMMFTAMLLTVTQPQPMKAMFLTGHGEHGYEDPDVVSGYEKFGLTLQQNFITNAPLSLLGSNPVPTDCNLLVIAGPTKPLADVELEKIQNYLDEGGRMLVMFNPLERTHQTGLERLLVRYDLMVGAGQVMDPHQTEKGKDIVVSAYSKHSLVNPLVGTGIQMILPRPLKAMQSPNAAADAPKVDLIAFSGENASLAGEAGKPGQFAVAAVIEKGAVPGVATVRGATRILVLGDSTLFVNTMIDKWSNREFAGYAANWLLDRTQLLEGVGPRSIEEFRIQMTREQLRQSRWLLLGGVPGAVLALGGLVWFRRRK